MLKNITMSAEEFLIQKAREKAQQEKKSLNEVFRQWLLRYTVTKETAQDYKKMLKWFRHIKAGKTFTRDEANER